jgi:hypothetical protein
MARYGEFKYAQAKYGASVPDRRLTWGVIVDWDDTGLFDASTNEMYNVLDINVRRGREFLMESNGQGFQRRFAGNIRIILRDISGRYDPFNITGPLYGKLEQNQRIKIVVKDEATGTIYPVFFGRIDDIRPNYGMPPSVTLTASDGINMLSQTNVRGSAVESSKQYDTAIADVLTAANWTDGTDINTSSSDAMAYFWMDGTSAYNQISELNDAVLGNFWIAADGKATFRPRIVNEDAAVTFVDHDALYSWKFRSPSPRKTIKNRVRVYSRTRNLNTAVELWRLSGTPSLTPGNSITIWADFNIDGESIPATSVTALSPTTDYTMNTAADGSGTDLTGQFTIVKTNFATTAKLVITNGSASTGFITLLKIRGNGLTPDLYTYVETTDAASIAIYGEREFVIQSNWLQDINSASEQATVVKTLLSSPRRYPQFLIRAQPAKQFAVDLNEKVSLNFTTLNYGADLRIGYIEHNVNFQTGGNICDTLFYFEPNLSADTGNTWIFPATFPMTF